MEDYNQKQREEFIDFWVKFVKTHKDSEWSKQQNLLINSQLQGAKQLSRKEYLEFRGEKFCL